MSEYYQRNKERLKITTKVWRMSHPEKTKSYAKKLYLTRQKLIQDAKNKPCLDCGAQYNPWIMTFDHRIPAQKSFAISSAGMYNRDRLLAEIAKCDVVCFNCHAERTHQQRLAGLIRFRQKETIQ